MNKLLTTSLLAAAAAASAATVSYNNTVTTNSTWADINLQKFNSNLGTLTGVTVEINYADVGGSFLLSTAGQFVFDSAESNVTIKGAVNALGFNQVSSGLFAVNTNPGAGTTVTGTSQTFLVDTTSALSPSSQSIAAGFFSAYQSAGGTGNVVFQVRNNPLISVTGNGYTLDSSLFTVTTKMIVTYTYTPSAVPEPSTYGIGLGGLALAGAMVRRRKQAK